MKKSKGVSRTWSYSGCFWNREHNFQNGLKMSENTKITMYDVLFVPKLAINLLTVRAAATKKTL